MPTGHLLRSLTRASDRGPPACAPMLTAAACQPVGRCADDWLGGIASSRSPSPGVSTRPSRIQGAVPGTALVLCAKRQSAVRPPARGAAPISVHQEFTSHAPSSWSWNASRLRGGDSAPRPWSLSVGETLWKHLCDRGPRWLLREHPSSRWSRRARVQPTFRRLEAPTAFTANGNGSRAIELRPERVRDVLLWAGATLTVLSAFSLAAVLLRE